MNILVNAINQGCTAKKFHQFLLKEQNGSKQYTQEEWSESLFAAIKHNRADLLSLLRDCSNSKHALLLDKKFQHSKGNWVYPLEYAIKNQTPEMVQKLIELGANVNVACHLWSFIADVGSFLHLAVLQANVSIIKILLEHGIKRHWHSQYFGHDMACTLAVESGKADAFIEAVGGILTEDELLELMCIQTVRSIEDLLIKNKVQISMDNKLEHHFKETQEERQTLLSSQGYENFVTSFPQLEIWRLFVDGKKQRSYDLALMSEIRGDTPQENMLYLSDDGERYLIPGTGPTAPPIEGSLSDLSDLQGEVNDETLGRIKTLFAQWKQNPMKSDELKKLILNIASFRNQIDRDSWSSDGWCGYESRERGCINTMYAAFDLACRGQQELSVEFIDKIHQQAMAHSNDFRNVFDLAATYALGPRKNLSLSGYLELVKPPYANWNRLRWVKTYGYLEAVKQNSSPSDLTQIINQYNKSQKETDPQNREQVLKNIILLSSSYSRLHPRNDGNNRTSTILLNSELIKHGFMPVILEDPNRLEGFSQMELLEEVYQGMRNTHYVMQHGFYPGGKSTMQYKASISDPIKNDIPDRLAQSFAELVPSLHMNILVNAIHKGCTAKEFHQFLLEEQNGSKQYTQEEWSESLFAAIKHNRADLLSLLKDCSNSKHVLLVDKKFQDSKGNWVYPLEYAIKNQAPEMVQKLIESGANVNVACHIWNRIADAGSFLHLAVLQANVSIIKILLEHGIKRHWHAQFQGYDMACTLAVESGKADAFIEAVGGILTEDELFELMCKQEARSIEDLLIKNKVQITMDKHHFKVTQEERQTLLSSQGYENFVTSFPPLEIWRLFVDGEKQRSYDLALMSEIKGDTPQENMLYLSDDGERYLIPSTEVIHPHIEGSLSDLSDLQGKVNDETLGRIKTLFEQWKQNPMKSDELKKLILDVASYRCQIVRNSWTSNFFNQQKSDEEMGWCGYESREPGCINTMYAAFDQACRGQQELSVEFISKIHQQVMAHSNYFINRFDTKAEYPLILRKNLSLSGYLELIKPPYANWNSLLWDSHYGRLIVDKINSSPSDLTQIINQYNKSQKETDPQNREQVLKNIILLSSSYSRLHPRNDGNNRTSTILLNSELIKHGFMPVILEDPNRLEGFSQMELLEEVYQGMRNTQYVMQHGFYPGGNPTMQYKASISDSIKKDIPDRLAQSFAELVPSLRTKLHETQHSSLMESQI